MAELLVNTGAILDNYRRYAAGADQVIPVLKGNGYGLGAAACPAAAPGHRLGGKSGAGAGH